MKSASRLFYLSVFALWSSSLPCASGSSDASPSAKVSPKSIVEDAKASFGTLDGLNTIVRPALQDLTHNSDFFAYYRLNLFNRECPFWDEGNGICGNIACAVETLDNEEDIPEVWRAKELGKLEGPWAKHPGRQEQKLHPTKPLRGELGEDVGESCVFEADDECDERDYCVPEDQGSAKGDYVSLIQNPERFTGYGGEGAKQVWDAIYRENCFQKSSFPHSANLGMPLSQNPAAQDFKHVLNAAGRHAQLQAVRQDNPNMPFVASTGYEVDDECLEKRVFYRVMSGMHTSISTHLCWDFLNQTTGEWQPNLACYKSRLHEHPERISNLYFNYALVTRAVAKLGPDLRGPQYTFCTGDASEDMATRAKVQEVTTKAASIPQIFDESLMFVNGEGPSLKEDFRNRFRNVSRLMDCVGCDKCRLWGKIQTSGYGTALKVLFESDNNSKDIPVLKRTELVALFNTYARLSDSMRAITEFRKMVAAESGDKPAPKDKALPPVFEDEHIEQYAQDDEDENELVADFVAFRDRGPKSDKFTDLFAYESKLFYKAMRIVTDGWLKAPVAFYYFATTELHRLYMYYLGLRPGPSLVKFKLPNLERRGGAPPNVRKQEL